MFSTTTLVHLAVLFQLGAARLRPLATPTNPLIAMLSQVFSHHRIQRAQILTDTDSSDLHELFLQSLAAANLTPPVQTTTHKLTTNQPAPDALQPRVVQFKVLARSVTVWFVVFIDSARLHIGREMLAHFQQLPLREWHHLGVVLVVSGPQKNEPTISRFMQHLWPYVEPRRLIAVHCNWTCATTHYHPILPSSLRPPSTNTNTLPSDYFTVKFDVNFLNAFAVVDAADRDERRDGVRINGLFVWIGQLMADQLNKTLHIVTLLKNFERDRRVRSATLRDRLASGDWLVTFAANQSVYVNARADLETLRHPTTPHFHATYPVATIDLVLVVPNENRPMGAAYADTVGFSNMLDLLLLGHAFVRKAMAVWVRPRGARSTVAYFMDNYRLAHGLSSEMPLLHAGEYIFRLSLSLFATVYASTLCMLYIEFVYDLSRQRYGSVQDVRGAQLPVYCGAMTRTLQGGGPFEADCLLSVRVGEPMRGLNADEAVRCLRRTQPERLALLTSAERMRWIQQIFWLGRRPEEKPYR